MKMKHRRGFTLVEMAIVLVIIGIILAGVMKGRDIVRGAQVKQFSQQFAQKWGTVCQTYYDKTGQQLNDGCVNGGSADNIDGWMDANAPSRASATAATGTGAIPIEDALNGVGIEPCMMIKSKLSTAQASTVGTITTPGNVSCAEASNNIFQTTVEGEYAGSTIVTVDLVGQRVTLGAAATAETFNRNLIVFYRVPADVARGLDTAIDGTENGELGSCVNLGDTAGADGYAATATSTYVGGGTTAIVTQPWADASSTLTLTTLALIQDY